MPLAAQQLVAGFGDAALKRLDFQIQVGAFKHIARLVNAHISTGAGHVGGLKVINPLGADQGIGPAQLHVSQHEQIQIRASRQMVRLDEQGLARPVLGGQQQGQQAAGFEHRRAPFGLGRRRLRQSHTHAQLSQHGP